MDKNRKGLCIASMILGIISIMMCAIQPFVFVASIVGLVIGVLGLKSDDGKGMAIAGIIMSAIGAFIGAMIMALFVGAINHKDNAIDFNSPNGGFYYHYEKRPNSLPDGFEYHIDEGPKEKNPITNPDNDSNLI